MSDLRRADRPQRARRTLAAALPHLPPGDPPQAGRRDRSGRRGHRPERVASAPKGARRAVEIAEAEGWRTSSLHNVVSDLRGVLVGLEVGEAVRSSQLRAATGRSMGSRIARAARVLDDLDLLVVDTATTMRAWVDRNCAVLPAGFRADVRAWLLVLTEGGPRARPRSPATAYAYLGRVRPHLLTWSSTREHLREVTPADVKAVLDQLLGHRRVGTFVALRSLFGFAKRQRMVFRDPTGKARRPARASWFSPGADRSIGSAPRR